MSPTKIEEESYQKEIVDSYTRWWKIFG